MRNPTHAEWTAAKRAVAKAARQVRDKTGNTTVKGFILNAFYDDGTVSFELRPSCDVDGVLAAARDLGFDEVWRNSLAVHASTAVTYPKEG